ncbi:MAG: DUF2935 domain-containing protein [Clostridiaceae bacterium]|nr:DUF2935 domain-containing protein [Clostridiaceae bacterium]
MKDDKSNLKHPEHKNDEYVLYDKNFKDFWSRIDKSVVMKEFGDTSESPECRVCICQYNRLEEARFWTRIFQEHALFIKLGLPADQKKFREEAQSFIEIFSNLRKRLEKTDKLEGDLLNDLIKAVKSIIMFKAEVLRKIIQCKEAPGSNYPLLLDHVRREADRFLGLILKPVPKDPLELLLVQEVFWLRIMKEHIEFVIHLLDPSERELIEQAEEFRKTFSRLLETARDLESMDDTMPKNFNTVVRFTEDVVRNTLQLRDFKLAAFELATMCKLLSIVSTPLLLDHIRREADKFLSELEVLLPEVIRCNSNNKKLK